MKKTKILMGMPITIEIIKTDAKDIFEKIFSYFKYVDHKFSTYKTDSEIGLINNGKVKLNEASEDMKKILRLASKTKKETNGYFDMEMYGKIDPSGIVKGWAIHNAAKLLKKYGFKNFYVEAGGDIEISGKNNENKDWKVGIRNPFKRSQIIKVLSLTNCGIATSGNYERGKHIYNPFNKKYSDQIASITIVGSNVCNADRFATASFAMGEKGIEFIEKQKNLEGYMINKKGIATFTSGFDKYTK